ncbi:MAG: endolytic transglycosylase MltG [Gammaproteobacteria bacterium]|nr:MAG: endolytic transglycosylase MltG [Gammaproteobacteria bacterium]
MSLSRFGVKGRFTTNFLVVVFAAGIGCAYLWFSFQSWLMSPLSIPQEGVHYEVETGRSLSHLSQDLAAQKLLTNPRWLNWYARFYNKEKIHPGEYALDYGLTPFTLLEKLNKGDVILHQVTFLEGWNFRQIIAALDEQPELTHLLSNKTDAQRLEILNLPISHPEGWFFPDTYRFTKGTSDVEILTQSYAAMRKLLSEMWEAKAPNLPYASDYEALIMASIVEKETGSASERDQIAGVFIRRLQRGMKLQTDPTVIYGMGELYAGKIGRNDLNRPTLYNTYAIQGLPPTPIAVPGRASLHAALHPDSGKSLYFVAKGDGTSVFSETLVEHQRAVARYQLQRGADYRSTPK